MAMTVSSGIILCSLISSSEAQVENDFFRFTSEMIVNICKCETKATMS